MPESPSARLANGWPAIAPRVRPACWIAPVARVEWRTALTTEQQNTAVALRGERLTIRVVAARLERPVSTVRRWLAGQGMSRLPPLDPPPPVRRYEHAAPGDLLHLDIKKLGRIVRPGHRVTGNPRDTVDGAGWECVHVAIDDHSRVGFSHAYPDETAGSAITFLLAAVAYYAGLGITIQRLLTDNGAAYRSKAFAAVCRELGIKQRFTRLHTPRTNGKAERFIQTALREWAYATTYSTSADRQAALQPWMHRYNRHRPRSALGYLPPISRIPRNNVSNLNSQGLWARSWGDGDDLSRIGLFFVFFVFLVQSFALPAAHARGVAFPSPLAPDPSPQPACC